MLVDSTFNKLQTLNEYVDDTEDYINIVRSLALLACALAHVPTVP